MAEYQPDARLIEDGTVPHPITIKVAGIGGNITWEPDEQGQTTLREIAQLAPGRLPDVLAMLGEILAGQTDSLMGFITVAPTVFRLAAEVGELNEALDMAQSLPWDRPGPGLSFPDDDPTGLDFDGVSIVLIDIGDLDHSH